MRPLIISYFTKDTPYEVMAIRLQRSAQQFGWAQRIEPMVDRGTWESNCAAKAAFCRRMRSDHRGPLLFLDADCWLKQPPLWFAGPIDSDVALQIVAPIDIGRGWFANRHRYHALRRGGLWNSGVILFQDTPAVQRLLDAWVKWCRRRPGEWDQVNLQRAQFELRCEAKVENIPSEYHAGGPVIGHESGFHSTWREPGQRPRRDVLLIGSAPSAPDWWRLRGRRYVDAGYAICALNNAWRAIPQEDLEYWFTPNDFDGDRPSTTIARNCDLDRQHRNAPINRERNWLIRPFWEPAIRTTLVDTCYHLLNEARHDGVDLNVHLAANDLIYRSNGQSHFYGQGRPDPLRYSDVELQDTLARVYGAYVANGYTIYNASTEPRTRLPFSRVSGPQDLSAAHAGSDRTAGAS